MELHCIYEYGLHWAFRNDITDCSDLGTKTTTWKACAVKWAKLWWFPSDWVLQEWIWFNSKNGKRYSESIRFSQFGKKSEKVVKWIVYIILRLYKRICFEIPILLPIQSLRKFLQNYCRTTKTHVIESFIWKQFERRGSNLNS